MWNQFNHLCYWELLWVNCLNHNYATAFVYAKRLFNENKWSRTIYLYQKSIILMQFRKDSVHADQLEQITDAELRADIEDELFNLDKNVDYCKFYKQRLSGKSLPMEKFILKKVKRYFSQNNYLVLPIFELIYVWNLFKCFQTKDKQSSLASLNAKNAILLQNFLKLFEREQSQLTDRHRQKDNESEPLNQYYFDNMMLLALLKGVCLKYLNLPLQALQTFQNALQWKAELKEDTHLVPFCIVEIALIEGHDLNNYDKAITILEDAK